MGFLTVTTAGTCRRVARILVKKTFESVSETPATPIELPKIRRPLASVVSPVTQPAEASPCASQCDCPADNDVTEMDIVSGLSNLVEEMESDLVTVTAFEEHCQNVSLLKTPPKTPPKLRRLFEGKFDKPEDYDESSPIARPAGIELELFHQDEDGAPTPKEVPPSIQLDLLVSSRRDNLDDLNHDVLSK